ncbi:MAG: recombinase family protein, partial [SAR324 cluster bacterium]|nr:recombinase family protein [SAR324 cluster bacterium]
MNRNVVAYYRTSSTTNVGTDKDSKKRQSQSVLNYTSPNGMRIVGEFYDKGVS